MIGRQLHPNQNYYDNNLRVNDLESIGTKCGEIFVNKNQIFSFWCTFCSTLFKDIITFTDHIKIYHIKQCRIQQFHNSLNEPEIKIESDSIKSSEESSHTTEKNNLMNIQNSTLSVSHNIPNNIENIEEKSDKEDEKYNAKDLIENQNVESLNQIIKNKTNSNLKIKNGRKSSITFSCDICDMKFDREIVLKSHKMYDHNPTYQDVEMNKEESIKKSIDSIKNDPLKCRYCDRRFKRRAKRFEHECSHTGERPYSCDICKKTFREKHSFTVHSRDHQANDKKYECQICKAKFKTKSNLKQHIRVHNNDRPHKCNYCDKSFINNAVKKIHESIHTGERRYQCSQCGKSFPTCSKLTVHVKRHNGEKSYKCDYCDKMFVTKNEKTDHERVHTKEKPYSCDECNATFQKSDGLKQHKKIHSDEFGYVCNICGKGFKQYSGLYCHKKSHEKILDQA